MIFQNVLKIMAQFLKIIWIQLLLLISNNYEFFI